MVDFLFTCKGSYRPTNIRRKACFATKLQGRATFLPLEAVLVSTISDGQSPASSYRLLGDGSMTVGRCKQMVLDRSDILLARDLGSKRTRLPRIIRIEHKTWRVPVCVDTTYLPPES